MRACTARASGKRHADCLHGFRTGFPGMEWLFKDLRKHVLQDAPGQVVFLFNGGVDADDYGNVKGRSVCGLHAQGDLLARGDVVFRPRMEKVTSFSGAMRS